MKKLPFWKTKSLTEMTVEEWESLCSRCGICCLHRFKDQKTGDVLFTAIACRHLDHETCRCRVYDHRFEIECDCNKVTRDNIFELSWLPRTCGYRTVAEERDLQWWHPLVSGDKNNVYDAGISIRDKDIISEDDAIAGDILKYLILPRSVVP